MITLSEKQRTAFGALHYDDLPTERVLYGGGAGSGKTLLGSVFQITRRIQYPNTRGLIGRKNRSELMNSTFKTFQNVYNKIALQHCGPMQYNGQSNIVSFPNGSEILMMHLSESPGDPEFQRLGSFELTDAFIDEVGECSRNAVDVVYSRIRYNLINGKPAMLLTSNPSYGWLKDTWIEHEGSRVTLPEKWLYIRALVQDNPDKEFVARYVETLNEMPLYHRLRLLDGSWDYETNESPYYSEFGPSVIHDGLEIDKDYPLEVSFDFNYDPTTLVISQDINKPGGGYCFYKELQKEGGTRVLCQELKQYLNNINWSGKIEITGDASGHKHDTRSGAITDFNIIQQELNIPTSWIDYNNKANMALGMSRDIFNYAFHRNVIKIDRKGCPGLINDFRIAKPKPGTSEFIKDRNIYKLDLLDAARYAFHRKYTNIKRVEHYAEYIGRK